MLSQSLYMLPLTVQKFPSGQTREFAPHIRRITWVWTSREAAEWPKYAKFPLESRYNGKFRQRPVRAELRRAPPFYPLKTDT